MPARKQRRTARVVNAARRNIMKAHVLSKGVRRGPRPPRLPKVP